MIDDIIDMECPDITLPTKTWHDIIYILITIKVSKWKKSPRRHFTKKKIEITEKKKRINES